MYIITFYARNMIYKIRIMNGSFHVLYLFYGAVH